MADKEKFTFSKKERVTGKRRIDDLFLSGESFLAYPFRVTYFLRESDEKNVSVLVSIPKKRLKRAVDRNRMKRLMREAYRLNRHQFKKENLLEGHGVDIAFIYVKDEPSTFKDVQKGVRRALREVSFKLMKKMSENEMA